MGCPICLDAFGEDTERGTRPVALPCGHVFHKACSDGWLKACRTKGDAANCPLCKKELGNAHALPLWLSDVSDLDVYMQHRSRRVDFQRNHSDRRPAPAALALDRYMSRDAQAALLGKMIDFRQHVNAYVMAVNNVSMSAYGGEERVFRLFLDTTKGEKENEEEFRRMLEALSGATVLLSEAVGEVETARKEADAKLEEARTNFKASDAMRSSFQKHMDTKAQEEGIMHKEKERVRMLELHVKRELQEVERRKEKMEKERQAYINEAREKHAEAIKARLESAQLIAQSRGDAEVKVSELNKYVQEQERLRIGAEDRARNDKKKNNWLADRTRLLSTKLEASRSENKRLLDLLASMKEGGAVPSRKGKSKAFDIKAEEDNNADADEREAASRDTEAKEEEEDDDDEDDVKIEWNLDSKKGASLDIKSDQWDNELVKFEELRRKLSQDSNPSGTGGGADGEKSNQGQHDTVVIEDDDLDAELDDQNYFMPTFGRATSSASVFGGGSSGSFVTASSSIDPSSRVSSASLTLPEGSNGRRQRNDDLDNSVEFVSIKRPRPATRSHAHINLDGGEQRRTSGNGVGIAGMLAGNDTLMDRIITGGRTWLGPRRRAR